MQLYQNKVYQKPAVQLVLPDAPDGFIATEISIETLQSILELPIYRDARGAFIYVNTANGTQRANVDDWVILEAEEQPASPGSPEVPEVPAVGEIKLKDTADGNGYVGFSYKGIIYAIEPAVGDNKEASALNLANVINVGMQLIATVSGDKIYLTCVPGLGSEGNAPLEALDGSATDTKQKVEITSGMVSGVDVIPAVPPSEATEAVFSVMDDATFNYTFEIVT